MAASRRKAIGRLPRWLTIAGARWPVVALTEKQDPFLVGKEGYSDNESARLVINRDRVPHERRFEVMIHEMAHAVLWVYGLTSAFAALKAEGVGAHKLEEQWILRFVPIWSAEWRANFHTAARARARSKR